MTSASEFILNVAQALGRQPLDTPPLRPPLPPNPPDIDLELGLPIFIKEVTKLSGVVLCLKKEEIKVAISSLVNQHNIQKAAIWCDDQTNRYGLDRMVKDLGVQLVPQGADKFAIATCDLGITTADFFIPETGTIGLLSSAQKPRAFSLLPRVHLALLTATDMCPNLPVALSEYKNNRYLTLVSGPSRTSDIELTLTIGVHGPKNLVIWIVDDK